MSSLVCLLLASSLLVSETEQVANWVGPFIARETSSEVQIEYQLPDRTRVDILTEEYAIEVDFGKKWAEGIGQALYYAHVTGKKPGLVILLEPPITMTDVAYTRRAGVLCGKYGIRLWVLQSKEED